MVSLFPCHFYNVILIECYGSYYFVSKCMLIRLIILNSIESGNQIPSLVITDAIRRQLLTKDLIMWATL